MMLELQLELN